MSLLISYDIEDNYLRKKIADYIIDAGFARVQFSVYIGTVNEKATLKTIAWLEKIPAHKNWKANDSILVLNLTELQLKNMLSLGNPKWDKDDLSDDRHTLIL